MLIFALSLFSILLVAQEGGRTPASAIPYTALNCDFGDCSVRALICAKHLAEDEDRAICTNGFAVTCNQELLYNDSIGIQAVSTDFVTLGGVPRRSDPFPPIVKYVRPERDPETGNSFVAESWLSLKDRHGSGSCEITHVGFRDLREAEDALKRSASARPLQKGSLQ